MISLIASTSFICHRHTTLYVAYQKEEAMKGMVIIMSIIVYMNNPVVKLSIYFTSNMHCQKHCRHHFYLFACSYIRRWCIQTLNVSLHMICFPEKFNTMDFCKLPSSGDIVSSDRLRHCLLVTYLFYDLFQHFTR